MRIAHISDCYLPRLGGIEAQVHGLARHQIADHHEVTVLTATPGRRGERHGAIDIVEGVPVRRLAIRLPLELPVNPFAPKDVRAILLSGRYDVVHIHAGVVSPFAYDAVKVVTDLGLPLVITWHCVLGRTERVGRLWERWRHWSRRPIAFTCVSDMAAEPLRRILGPQVPVSVLPNGVDARAWRVDHLPHPDGDVRLVSAMRLASRKRPAALVHMAADARARLPASTRLTLSLLGEGSARARVESAVAARGAGDWVRLLGRLDRPQMLEVYAGCDVYVAPATMESFGIAAIEARAAGLPVIARADSGVTEFVDDGQEGLLVGTDEEMVDAIVRLASDPALRQRIATHNRATTPIQDWPHVVQRAGEEYARAARIRAMAA